LVITVTLNPAIDKTLTVDNFSCGVVNRASSLRWDIGGKGINVSKVLKNFGVESICTGFLGGALEHTFVEEFKKRDINSEFIHIAGETRTNTKIVDNANKVFTDVNEKGPEISSEELEEFINKFTVMCKKQDIVVLSGGVPQGIPDDIYFTLTTIARKKGTIVIMDADGELLRQGIKGKPDIIKPNEDELSNFFHLNIKDNADIIIAADKLRKLGIDKVLVSQGGKGAILLTENEAYQANAIKTCVRSTVGAGDSMVAALVYSQINNYSQKKTLEFAIACGAASVSIEGTGACTLNQVNTILNNNKIETKEVTY
jgi:1-phosphofructokinase